MTLLDQRPVRSVPRPPAPRRTARLLLVDGEAIVRFGLRQLFAADPDLVVVGEAAGPRDALALADRCPPDLAEIRVLPRPDASTIWRHRDDSDPARSRPARGSVTTTAPP